jgi:N-acetylglutamate synthase and related acetyltransferases
MEVNMNNTIIDCEISYSKCFSDYRETQDVLRFCNTSLPGMYDYNFTYIKNRPDNERLLELIKDEVMLRTSEKQSFCKIIVDFPTDDMLPAMFSLRPEIGRLGIYTLCNNSYMNLLENEICCIKKIDNQKTADDKSHYDLLLDKERLGDEFCQNRAIVQCQTYLNDGGVDAYICYHDGIPVGTCELYLSNNIAKIENFTVLPNEQRKKYGTSILKYMITLANERKAQAIYLVTDEDDTAKDMYCKFGFEKTDEMTEIFFTLSCDLPDKNQ